LGISAEKLQKSKKYLMNLNKPRKEDTSAERGDNKQTNKLEE